MEKLTGLYDLRIPFSTLDKGELIARAIRDCFVRNNGELNKELMDMTIEAVGKSNPQYKAVWKDFKKTFEIEVKDGVYINPFFIP